MGALAEAIGEGTHGVFGVIRGHPGDRPRRLVRAVLQWEGASSMPAALMSARAMRPSSGLTGSVRSVRTCTR